MPDETECQMTAEGSILASVSTSSIDTRLAAGGRRRTAQRLIVAEALAGAKRALSAQELYDRIRASHPTIGRATVYRALEQQVEDGMASRFERDGHVSAYIACDAEHHHHLVCTNCQRVEDVAEDVVGPMLGAVGRRHDFSVDHAALDFYGLCARCRTKRG
ncbi:MAG: transcriptional repressor [Chloroflexi bacterium]|nr:MAG: transcriptional repressor [Chloroflexota bacterium]